MESKIFEHVEKAIIKKGEISPFLFISQNLEILNNEVESFAREMLVKNNIDVQSLFHLSDNWETLKIDELKKFISFWDVRPRFAFQIFLIENISRMSPQSQNACLKFFEEPGEGNIILLTNNSESGILETILSRVQILQSWISKPLTGWEWGFYYSMIWSHIEGSSDELIRYFFSWKFEKSEYIDFLKALIWYIYEYKTHIHLLDELHDDINGILKNNLQGKYIVDKYILLLTN